MISDEEKVILIVVLLVIVFLLLPEKLDPAMWLKKWTERNDARKD